MATVMELKTQARHLGITGYSKMLKAELEKAIADKAPVSARVKNYQKQNGSDRLTARQSRRDRHKRNRNGI